MYKGLKNAGISLALIAALVFVFAAPVTAQMRTAPAAGIPANELIGKDVKAQNGEFLGKVDDIVLSRHGRVKDVVVSMKDTNRLVAVPMHDIRFTDQNYVVYTGNRTDLAGLSAPGVYGYRSETTTVQPAPKREDMVRAGKGGYWKPSWQQGYGDLGYWPIPANDIIGMDVRSQNGEFLGKVDDIMFSSQGRIRDVIVDVDNTNHLVAVPMSDIRFTDQNYVVYTGNRTDLAALPAAPGVYGYREGRGYYYYPEEGYVEPAPKREDMVRSGEGGYWKPSWQQGYQDLGHWPEQEGTIRHYGPRR